MFLKSTHLGGLFQISNLHKVPFWCPDLYLLSRQSQNYVYNTVPCSQIQLSRHIQPVQSNQTMDHSIRYDNARSFVLPAMRLDCLPIWIWRFNFRTTRNAEFDHLAGVSKALTVRIWLNWRIVGQKEGTKELVRFSILYTAQKDITVRVF